MYVRESGACLLLLLGLVLVILLVLVVGGLGLLLGPLGGSGFVRVCTCSCVVRIGEGSQWGAQV